VVRSLSLLYFLKHKRFCILIASMRVRVLLFGQLKDIFGLQEEVLEVPPGTSLADLVARYAEQFPKFKPIAGSIACSVNREYARGAVILREGDEVGLLPPVSGGKKGTGDRLQGTGQNQNRDLEPAATEECRDR
jgi:molybdopterin converting factor small subunit